RPDEGAFIVNTEFAPIASPEFEPGPPSGEAIEVARVVDRGIRESNAIDLSKLCIKEGEKVWLIYVDIYVLNHDGNLIDASALAALGALLNARFPKVEDEKIVYGELTNEKLPIRKLPICCTFAKIGNRFLIDPCLREEVAMDVGLSVTTTSGGKVNALQKLGKNTGLREDEISKCVEMAIRKGRELRQLFKKV
ncbi:RNA-binding protein, partial [Nanoarchaeota archaeon]